MKRRPSSSVPTSVDTTCTIAYHERIKANERAWRACIFVGFQSDGLIGGTTYEMRNCLRCGSTMNLAAQVRVERYLHAPRPSDAQHANAAAKSAA